MKINRYLVLPFPEQATGQIANYWRGREIDGTQFWKTSFIHSFTHSESFCCINK